MSSVLTRDVGVICVRTLRWSMHQKGERCCDVDVGGAGPVEYRY